MLVLSRKVGQTITIGDSIMVKVTMLSGNRVRLAIQAPSHLSIRRVQPEVEGTPPTTGEEPAPGPPGELACTPAQ